MKILATLLAGRKPLRRLPDFEYPSFARPPSRFGLLAALVGLSILLFAPMLARYHAARYRAHIEDDIEPAREQINGMLAGAYKARGDVLLALATRPKHASRYNPASHSSKTSVAERQKNALQADRAILACSSRTYEHWQKGKSLLFAAAQVYKHSAKTSPQLKAEGLNEANKLFQQGIIALRNAQTSASLEQTEARERLRSIGRVEIAVTVPVALTCLLLAASTWQAQARLRRFWLREYKTNCRLKEANARLEALATIDGLTGLKNHRAFQEWLADAFEIATYRNNPISLLLLDVDRFKQVNDTHGHPAGDEILKQVAGILQQTCRATDCAARYGGEEFVIVLPDTDRAGALRLAERFRIKIASAPWTLSPITASFGVATWSGQATNQAQLIADADAALYASKRNGRNCVTHAVELLPQIDQSYAITRWQPDTVTDVSTCKS